MVGNTFGKAFSVTTFGESHGGAVGVVVDGARPGVKIDTEEIQVQLDRRKPGRGGVASSRREPDRVNILSGFCDGKTTGTPILMILYNKDADSKAYEHLRNVFRPGHADYVYMKKYGIRDWRGGGRSSGRETAARVAAGAIARKCLQHRGISLLAYTRAAAGVWCREVKPDVIENNALRACEEKASKEMEARIANLQKQGDSAGGVVECRIRNVPPGLGAPVFDKLDACLAAAIFSIGAVKGVEFGTGFAAAEMTGSEHNDQMDGNGFLTNNAGGILGGLSNGEDIVFRVAVKPTPSIAHPQQTVDHEGCVRTVEIEGRHDACICPRIVPVVEAMACLVLENHIKRHAALMA